MSSRLPFAIVIAAIFLSACGTAASPPPGGSATAGPASPPGTAATTPGATRTSGTTAVAEPELRIRLIERFGPLWYCDSDYWPIARDDEQALAVQRWPEIAADAATLAAVLRHLGMGTAQPATDAGKLAVYREWKVLRAIALDPAGSERFAFDYLAMPAGGSGDGTRSKGTIDRSGSIIVTSSAPAPQPMCPICLARGQPVETPLGPIAVERLGLGDPVWTLDQRGQPLAAVVIALGSTVAPRGHVVVRLRLDDGRVVVGSPGHPVADGRTLGELRIGDGVQGARVASAERLEYDEGETFDLRSSGPTGTYAAGGIWLGSTLGP